VIAGKLLILKFAAVMEYALYNEGDIVKICLLWTVIASLEEQLAILKADLSLKLSANFSIV